MPGNVYSVERKICFGRNENGYHFCKNFEDSLKYLEVLTRDFKLAKVRAFGDIKESFDRYNGVYDIYVASSLEILAYLTEDEIFSMALQLSSIQIKRFLQFYPLNGLEKERFKQEYKMLELGVMQNFDYYQENKKDAFSNVYEYFEKTESGMVYMKKWK